MFPFSSHVQSQNLTADPSGIVRDTLTSAPVECMVGNLHKVIDYTQNITCEISHEKLNTVWEISISAAQTITTNGSAVTQKLFNKGMEILPGHSPNFCAKAISSCRDTVNQFLSDVLYKQVCTESKEPTNTPDYEDLMDTTAYIQVALCITLISLVLFKVYKSCT